jgi:hypothetical protein
LTNYRILQYNLAHVTEDQMRIAGWNEWIAALSLVHLGQQLGTEGPLARAVFDLGSLVISFLGL